MPEKTTVLIKTDPLGRVLMGEVQRITGWSRWTLLTRISKKEFAEAIAGWKRGQSRKWRESDVRDWMHSILCFASQTSDRQCHSGRVFYSCLSV
jgi:predicted DNA-binding transcriptional regulator AlpA